MRRARSNAAALGHPLRVGVIAVLSSWLAGCVNHDSFMGIPLRSGQADVALQQLATRARAGDKQAQLQLGIRFEEGRALPVDLKRAIELYRRAASDSGGIVWIYSPSVKNGTKGRVVPIDSGALQPGLSEARQRLDALTGLAPRTEEAK